MMRIRFVIISLIALFAACLQAAFCQPADTLALSDKAVRTASMATAFRGEVWQSPALYYYYTPYTWTTLDVNGTYHDKGEASLRQEGDEDTRIGVDVSSFVILSGRDRVFGSAGYRSERQENVVWNENIDWAFIAPYVTGDSIGGFLKGETYYFNGGYAAETGLWSWGITGGYRASHNYRDKDPRPRNTASDLSFALGASRRLGAYRIGVSADFRLYQQKSEITFLADKGSTSVYHMLGLGMDYVRFAGNQTGTKHQGTQWGGSIGILPVDSENGVSATVALTHMAMDKKLSGANNLTLLKAGTTDWSANVAWMRQLRLAEHIAVKLCADHTVRKGTENIYGEAGGSSYGELISTSPGTKVANSRLTVCGMWEKLPIEGRTWGGALLPSVGYCRLNVDYTAASRYVHLSAVECELRARVQYRKRLLRLTAEADGGYFANLSAEQSLPGLVASKSSAQTLLANVGYLSDSYGTVGVRLQGDYPVLKQYNLSLSVQWATAFYKECGTTRYAACSLGVFF